MPGFLRLSSLVSLSSLLSLLLPLVSGQSSVAPYSVFYQSYPACAVAVDSSGSIYVGLSNSPSLLKLDSSLHPVPSFTSQASAALLPSTSTLPLPFQADFLAVTSSGFLWLHDFANQQLFALSSTSSPTAVTATIPLSPLQGAYGMATSPSSPNVWVVAPWQPFPLWQFTPQGNNLAQLGPSNSPHLSDFFIQALGIDASGNLYVGGCSPMSAFVYLSPQQYSILQPAVCDVRQFTAAGVYLQTFWLPGSAPMPVMFTSIAVNAAGAVYALDQGNAVTYEWSASTGQLLNTANTSLLVFALAPSGDLIGVSGDGAYVVDLNPSTLAVQSSVAIASGAVGQEIAVALSPDYLTVYAVSDLGGPIAAFNTSGYLWGYYGAGVLQDPQNLCTDSSDNLYVTDAALNAVVKLSPSGTLLTTFKDPSLAFTFSEAQGLAIDPRNGNLVVADAYNSRLVVFSPTGAVSARLSTAFAVDTYSFPQDVVITSTGTIIYTDGFHVTEIDPSGAFLRQFNLSTQWAPFGLAMAPDGRLFVSDLTNRAVYSFGQDGSLLGSVATSSAEISAFGLAYSPAQLALYAADLYNNRLLTFPIAPVTPSTVAGSMCAIFYSLPGDVDYPWSVATSLTFQYNPTPISTGQASAVQVVSGSGTRTFTNRFGVSSTAAVTIAAVGTSGANNLVHLNSRIPFDAAGLLLTVASPIQLPGRGPSQLYSSLALTNVSGYVGESASSRLDPYGQAFASSIPGFTPLTIGAGNVNGLAVRYTACQAPLTFTNGLRAPTQPFASNGAAHFSYAYSLSDGATYHVQTSLTVSADSAFATSQDALGNPYQTVVAVTGTRTYTYLPTGAQVTSTVTGLSTATSASADQRWYPYSLLASPPGIYSMNTAPYLDYDGLEFAISPSAPANGAAPGQGTQYGAVSVYMTTTAESGLLEEGNSLTQPSVQLQTQSYTLTP